MPNLRSADMNLMKELRLRRWARENYVSAEERGEGWHEVVMDEMLRKDAELLEQAVNRSVTLAYVPLMPDNRHSLHEPHVGLVAPYIVVNSAEPARLVERTV